MLKPIRTMGVMEKMAREALVDDGPFKLFSDDGKPIYNGIEGPIITDNQDRVKFTWYKVLEWGDTAKISAYVYKNFLIELNGVFRKKNPPSVAADEQWQYVYLSDGISKFTDVIPQKYKNETQDAFKVKYYHNQNETSDSIKFIIMQDRLFYFLQKGYFSVEEKNNDYTTVEFYEHIANIVHKRTNQKLDTRFAKVFVNDSLEVIIVPYDLYGQKLASMPTPKTN